MQGCLKSAIVALRKSVDVEQEPLLYVAFFNFSVGLERLLKLNLILDHCVEKSGAMPTNKTLKDDFGHNVVKLYGASEKLHSKYKIQVSDSCLLDSTDRRLIKFLGDFAIKGRYFNLDDLTGNRNGEDPIPEWGRILNEIYSKDVSAIKQASNEEQVEALADSLKKHTVYVPATGLDGKTLSYEEFYQDQGKMRLVMPKVIWRLIKILCPMKELIFILSQRLHTEQMRSLEVPFMEEFLEFVCADESIVSDEEEGWPYFA